jgi:hypothetical protein
MGWEERVDAYFLASFSMWLALQRCTVRPGGYFVSTEFDWSDFANRLERCEINDESDGELGLNPIAAAVARAYGISFTGPKDELASAEFTARLGDLLVMRPLSACRVCDRPTNCILIALAHLHEAHNEGPKRLAQWIRFFFCKEPPPLARTEEQTAKPNAQGNAKS